jgi:hypothetical protein
MTTQCNPQAPHSPASAYDQAKAIEIDMAMLEDKLNDGYGRRNQDAAMRLQLNYQLKTGEFL